MANLKIAGHIEAQERRKTVGLFIGLGIVLFLLVLATILLHGMFLVIVDIVLLFVLAALLMRWYWVYYR